MLLENKVAVVTGGGTGIGRAIAQAMATEGAAVIIDYIGKPDKAEAVVKDIESAGGKAIAVEADVSDADQVSNMIFQAVAKFGKIDALVNNAGVEEKHPFLETPLDVWHKMIQVNLTGPWVCSLAAARQMVQQGHGGRIINISSVHEDIAMPTNAPYCAAKGGLRMLMRTIAVELAPHRILVNNVAPGAIETPMDAAVERDPTEYKRLLAEIPVARMGRPEDVASMCVFLASDDASYCTGSTFFVDGGMMRQSGNL